MKDEDGAPYCLLILIPPYYLCRYLIMMFLIGNEGVDVNTNLWGEIFSFLADENYHDTLFTCRSINRGFKKFIDVDGVMFTWRIAAQKKFGPLLSSKFVLDEVYSREDFLSLPSLRDYSIWIIKRAMYRYKLTSETLRILTDWTPQLASEDPDPCIICGVRWCHAAFQKCHDGTCPFQYLIFPFRRVSRHMRLKSLEFTRLFVCKDCGDKQPSKAMREFQFHPDQYVTTLCFMCAKRTARIARNSYSPIPVDIPPTP